LECPEPAAERHASTLAPPIEPKSAWLSNLPTMSIVNRRNAILGWTVWTISKTAAKRKAKQAVTAEDDSGSTGKRAAAAVSGLAATGGAIYFWRRRRGGDETES
jgi:hypothetical protein